MDTSDQLGDILGRINMDEVRKHLELGEKFPLPVPVKDAQAVLEECGLIWNPKSETYQSLEEGDRWKVVGSESGGVIVMPAPILYDTGAMSAINNMPLGGRDELAEDEARLEGLTADSDSFEGKVMDGPQSKENS